MSFFPGVSYSPPLESEYRKIYMPAGMNEDEADLMDVMFILKFKITSDPFGHLAINMKVMLNPALQAIGTLGPSSPPLPEEYTFNKAGICAFVYTEGDYYINGNITVKAITPPNGQFDNNTKNFFFGVEFGKAAAPSQAVDGLFILYTITEADY